MTTGTDQNTSISCGIDVSVPPASAFAVFTAGFDRWWNRDHHLLKADLKQAVIEAGVGGRVYEESVDGEICEQAYVDPDQLTELMVPRLARRVAACVLHARTGNPEPLYLEHGFTPAA